MEAADVSKAEGGAVVKIVVASGPKPAKIGTNR
jgi:hypothetical protein